MGHIRSVFGVLVVVSLLMPYDVRIAIEASIKLA